MRIFRRHPKPHFILFIGDDGVLCVPIGINIRTIFTTHGDDLNEARITQAIKNHPDLPVNIVVDILGQDFRHEALPPMSWFDRKHLVARRLMQAFPHSILRKSILLTPTTCLLIGVHDHDVLTKWIDKLQSHAPRINLLPYEMAPMLKQLVLETTKGWALLISVNETGGVRQVVTRDGQLVFTRLTPPLAADGSTDDSADTLSRDIMASRGYLGRFGLNDDVALQIIALVAPDVGAALEKFLPTNNQLYVITPYEAAAKLDLPQTFAKHTIFSDMLYATWMACRRPRLSLWLPKTHKARIGKIRHNFLSHAALVALCCAVAVMSTQGVKLFIDLTSLHKVQQEIASLNTAIEAERQKMPADLPLGRLRTAIERKRLYSEPVTNPWSVLTGLSTAMGDTARLQHIEWRDASSKDIDEVLNVTMRILPQQVGVSQGMHDDAAQDVADKFIQRLPQYTAEITRYPHPQTGDDAIAGGDNANSNKPQIITADITIKRVRP